MVMTTAIAGTRGKTDIKNHWRHAYLWWKDDLQGSGSCWVCFCCVPRRKRKALALYSGEEIIMGYLIPIPCQRMCEWAIDGRKYAGKQQHRSWKASRVSRQKWITKTAYAVIENAAIRNTLAARSWQKYSAPMMTAATATFQAWSSEELERWEPAQAAVISIWKKDEVTNFKSFLSQIRKRYLQNRLKSGWIGRKKHL